MKIDLTPKEYRLLIESLYLSDWMMHSHTLQAIHEDHAALKEKLLSHYKEMQAEDIVEKSETEHFVSTEIEDYAHKKFIDPYDNRVFWEELIDRLAERDVIRAVGSEEFQAMNRRERGKKIEELKVQLSGEFKEHGLARILIES